MNPYYAISAIFLLGLRGIKKKLSLPGPPIGSISEEERRSGKVRDVSAAWIMFCAPWGSVSDRSRTVLVPLLFSLDITDTRVLRWSVKKSMVRAR